MKERKIVIGDWTYVYRLLSDDRFEIEKRSMWDSEIVSYAVHEFKTDFGRGFRVARIKVVKKKEIEAEVYNVCVGEDEICECRSYTSQGVCKHIDAIGLLFVE